MTGGMRSLKNTHRWIMRNGSCIKVLKSFGRQHRLKFKNSSVINNVINEHRFPYHAKNAEDRKKIIIIRKFDNCMVHSLDLSVRAILELSRKEFFKELSFEIYGDGDFTKC